MFFCLGKEEERCEFESVIPSEATVQKYCGSDKSSFRASTCSEAETDALPDGDDDDDDDDDENDDDGNKN
ncbi:hypothetical protein PoB_001796200 [Plakobranchus ocellatus]|uniref:Uncharacterized protein n=1 Tax=Plakobranchus ocellatus TaxID=259542 RepID=A0AAV3Z889_9GAST|nr:hypothetical protein PoB_001796200 [Plakobranchus ocellatus]